MSAEKEVVRVGPFAGAIASGVKKRETIYLSGQVSIDSDGQLVGEGDLVAQVRQAYANVEEVLEQFGATMEDLVDEIWFVTDISGAMGNLESVFGARQEAYGGEPQVTQTLIEVSALAMPGLMIEIKCIAVT